MLLSALSGPQPEHQVAAARSLGYRREPSAVAPMLGLATRPETAPAVRSAAIEALGRIGDRRAIPALHDLLHQEPREELRAEAAAALGAIAAAESLPELLRALKREPSLIGRAAIVGALGAWRRPEAVAALAAILDDPRQRALRSRAVRALGHTGPDAAPPLLAALRAAGSERERAEVVEALGNTGAESAVAPLSALAAAGTSDALRARIVVALGSIGGGSAVPALIALLGDPAAPVRYYAVRGLAEAGDRRAAAPLRALFADVAGRQPGLAPGAMPHDAASWLSDLTLQIEIATALIDLDAPGSFDLFAQAVGAREFPRDSALGLRLNEGVYELRRAATVGLGYSKAAAAAPLLADGPLRDRDPRLRAAAVRALGVLGTSLGGARSLGRLVAMLEDGSPEVRWEAAFVLGRLGQDAAVLPLAGRLSDGHAEVRRQAALSLGMLGAGNVRPALRAMAAQDPDERTRAAASVALRALGTP